MSKKNVKSAKEVTKAEVAAEKQKSQDAVTASAMQGTEAGDIWNEIKDKNIEMFALPDQVVSMHVRPVPLDANRLFLVMNSTAVLPSLETALGKKYSVELADKFVIVTRAVVPPTLKR